MENNDLTEDLHDQLVREYLNYFRENEKWEQKDSVRKYYAVQKHIKKIKKLAARREKQIRKIHIHEQEKLRQKKIKNSKGKNDSA